MRVIPSILSGKPVVSKRIHPVFSNTSVHLHDFSSIDKSWIPQICTTAMKGFSIWKARPFEQRAKILHAAADLVEQKSSAYIEAHQELGCVDVFARVGVSGTVANIREYASRMSDPEGSLLRCANARMAMSVKSPIGPVLSLASWNAPVILAARAIAAPLAAGCSVVVKANEKAPRVPSMLVNDFLEAGVDPEALQLIHVAPGEHADVTDELLENAHIRMVNFTGSSGVGRHLAQSAARNFKPALLELGGKNVSVVLADADVEKAAVSALFSAWLHMGQICMCLDTVYVEDQIYDTFKARLHDAAAAMLEDDAFVYAQRDADGAEKVRWLIEEAMEKGARAVISGGSASNPTPQTVFPLILENVSAESPISAQETFGPVLCIEKFSSLDAVVAKANASPYGLKASVWSRDVLQAVDVAKRLEAGGVHINSSTIHDEPTIPHGGVKASGSGRFNSTWGIESFQYTKAITVS